MEPTPDLEMRGKSWKSRSQGGVSRHHAAVSLVRVPEAEAKTEKKPETRTPGQRKLVNSRVSHVDLLTSWVLDSSSLALTYGKGSTA
jgi:hypothetical protein